MWKREYVGRGWKGKEGGVVLYFNGLWRNLPVRSELREEEPVGCGTPDKGDIYLLTLDHWSKRRGTEDNSQLLDYFFCVLEKFLLCVCQLYGFICELRDVCAGAVVPICCL